MYLHLKRDPAQRKRGKSNRSRAKNKAKDRRRVNGMRGHKLGRRLRRNG